jgi:gamma-tubulin complex component 3
MRGCVAALLAACCRPLYTMLLRWLLDGSLEDPHGEFFICGEPGVQGEALWHHKYSVRQDMVPRFLSAQWTGRILSCGKAINFLVSVCREASAAPASVLARLQALEPAALYQADLDSPLLEAVGAAWRAASRHVMDVMCEKFQLLAHLGALRKYLLLGQGDLMRYLLDLLEPELGQPATQLMPHNLAGILETAVRGTNTQYEPPEILGRLDVKLLEIQPGDSGWDVFSLDYKVTGPIGVVFTPDTMTKVSGHSGQI